MKTLRYLTLIIASALISSCNEQATKPPVLDIQEQYDIVPDPIEPTQMEAQVPPPRVYRAIAIGRASPIPSEPQTVSGSYNVTKRAVIRATMLDTKFRGVLKGFGQHIIDQCRQRDLCPLFVAGVLMHESANGTSKFAKEKNNVSGIYDSKKKLYRTFDDVQQCIDFTIDLLASRNYAGRHRTTISQIQKLYCPVGADNDPKGINSHWQSGVRSWMTRIAGADTVYCIE